MRKSSRYRGIRYLTNTGIRGLNSRYRRTQITWLYCKRNECCWKERNFRYLTVLQKTQELARKRRSTNRIEEQLLSDTVIMQYYPKLFLYKHRNKYLPSNDAWLGAHIVRNNRNESVRMSILFDRERNILKYAFKCKHTSLPVTWIKIHDKTSCNYKLTLRINLIHAWPDVAMIWQERKHSWSEQKSRHGIAAINCLFPRKISFFPR